MSTSLPAPSHLLPVFVGTAESVTRLVGEGDDAVTRPVGQLGGTEGPIVLGLQANGYRPLAEALDLVALVENSPELRALLAETGIPEKALSGALATMCTDTARQSQHAGETEFSYRQAHRYGAEIGVWDWRAAFGVDPESRLSVAVFFTPFWSRATTSFVREAPGTVGATAGPAAEAPGTPPRPPWLMPDGDVWVLRPAGPGAAALRVAFDALLLSTLDEVYRPSREVEAIFASIETGVRRAMHTLGNEPSRGERNAAVQTMLRASALFQELWLTATYLAQASTLPPWIGGGSDALQEEYGSERARLDALADHAREAVRSSAAVLNAQQSLAAETHAGVSDGDTVGGYRLLSLLAEGGMGEVWRAEQVALGRLAAVKVIRRDLASDPEFRRRFAEEARAAAAIDHPNVVTVFDAGEANGWLYLAMALVSGGTLRELLDRDGLLPQERAADVVRQVGAGLDAAHVVGLVHRDVKPANILIEDDPGGRVRITDFGVAKARDGSGLTRTGGMVGTLDYLAPEQVEGRPVDARTDVYALGCLLFETLTGRVPFARDSAPARMWAHVNEPPPRPSELAPVSPALDAVVAKAMAKRPEDRYPTAGALGAAAMEAVGAPAGQPPAPATVIADRPPAPATEVSTPAALPAERRRSPGTAIAIALAALALLAVGVVAALALGDRSSGPGTTSTVTNKVTTKTNTTSNGKIGRWSGGPGYTVFLASIPQTQGRSAAVDEAQRAIVAGIPQVGILNSFAHTNTRKKYWVPFSGHFTTEAAALTRLARVKRAGVGQDPYVRFVPR